jgi:hypothetical protein
MLKAKQQKNYVQRHMSPVGSIRFYHFQANVIWWDGPIKKKENIIISISCFL